MGRVQHYKPDKEEKQVCGFLQMLVILLALGLGVTVAVGLRGVLSDEGGFVSWLVPIVFAAVLSTILAGLWHVTLRMALTINPRDPQQLWTVIGYALALTCVHGATSMPFLASAIGGRDAVEHHQMEAVTALSLAADTISANAEARERISSALTGEAEELGRLLAQEVGGLGQSREPGFGPLARQIEQAMRALQDGGDSFDGQSALLGAQIAAARDHVTYARDASALGDHETFAAHFGEARSLLGTAASQGETTFDPSYNFAGSGIPGVRAVAPRLDRLIRENSLGGTRVLLPVYEPLSRPVAVLTYPEAVPLAWSVAIAADFLALGAVALLLLFRLGRQR